jgi:F-type H+-transporting ATPase subunit b
MLDIQPLWFAVQLANFLILLYLLNRILFRPLLNLFREREERTKGSLENAKGMDSERDGLLEEIEKKLSGARNRAREVFEGISREGLEEQKKFVEEATDEAAKIAQQAGAKLRVEAQKVKETLRSEVESFSKTIVEKMIGA